MDINDLLQQQKVFFNSNETKSVAFRIEQLKKLKSILKSNEDSLYQAIYEDFGKSEFETYVTELSLVYHEISNYIKNIPKWSKRKRVGTNLVNFPAKSYIIPEPLGNTLVIGAWNYPYQLSLLPAITALAAGNTVILKPSELPKETAALMAELINSNFPKNYFHVVEGGVDITTELLNHRFDKIFFTGSTKVGKIVYQAAAKHLTPVTLELGGKSPTFVLDDTNVKMTAKRIVWAKFLNAGQTCVAPDYILVEKTIETRFLEALKAEIENHYDQNYTDAPNYLQIINTTNFERLVKLINQDKLYFGGQTNKDARFISPTILNKVSFEDEVMKDEIFGPILPVISFSNLDDAIQKVKDQPSPLSCYIYSKSNTTIKKILKEVSFGGGAVNDSLMHLSNSKLPFGGVGLSGIGAYHGKTGFDAFSHQKSILHKSFWLEPNLKYSPYSNMKLRIIKWLMG
ncbi:aldehyde dehydrogenase [Tamlana sp. 2_MG-2023]|uniref:aldehyde dehydrogenase n=1 Tax=unclassified Tamlana TaxID=2614803 RepID=UPI0026E286BD|nr:MULTISPECIES: aldehyde dehydrogenase [unclassified Tamlana]MDO6758682.1 aldehyde dehydrogenase [Tamlana sp. 2_MG-2023]MDO6789381.1 aldehyde dehydrogenase [Tamlana sp. 1_MG-2023]